MQGFPTLRGSRLVDPDRGWPEDAPATARLREAGAVILGKTTTPEVGWKALGDSPLTGTYSIWSRLVSVAAYGTKQTPSPAATRPSEERTVVEVSTMLKPCSARRWQARSAPSGSDEGVRLIQSTPVRSSVSSSSRSASSCPRGNAA